MRPEIQLLQFLGNQPCPISLEAIMKSGAINADRGIHSLILKMLLGDGYVAKTDGTYTITAAGRERLISLANAITLNDNTRGMLNYLEEHGIQTDLKRALKTVGGNFDIDLVNEERDLHPDLKRALQTAGNSFNTDLVNMEHIGYIRLLPVANGELHYAITPAGHAALAG